MFPVHAWHVQTGFWAGSEPASSPLRLTVWAFVQWLLQLFNSSFTLRPDLSKPTILFFTFVHAEKSKRTSPGGRHCRISATKFLLHVDFCISLALCSFMGKENQIITIFKRCLKCVLSIHCRKRTTQRPI